MAKRQPKAPPQKPRIGRPTLYTPELAARICKEIALGTNLSRLCLLPGWPTRETIYNWFNAYPTFFDAYVCAREQRADTRSDRMDDMAAKMLKGKLDPNAVRVALQNEQWQAAREAPRRFGDRVVHANDPTMPMPATNQQRVELMSVVVNILDREGGAAAAAPVQIEVAPKHPAPPPALYDLPTPGKKTNGHGR